MQHAAQYRDGLTAFELHRAMLGDRVRNLSFREAIHRTVRPNDLVVDLGAGTGLLGLFACQAGARRILAIERGPFEGLARCLYAENGFADRLVWINRDSLEVELLEKADVLISETLGNVALDEGLLRYLPDARRRFLRPNGRMVPERVALFAAPCVHALPTSRRDGPGLPLTPWGSEVQPAELIGPATRLGGFDLRSVPVGCELFTRVEIVTEETGMFTGMAAWFVTDLAEGIQLTTSPYEQATHWRQVIFPAEQPMFLAAGSKIVFTLSSNWKNLGTCWHWSFNFGDDSLASEPRLDDTRRMRTDQATQLHLTEQGEEERELLEKLAAGADVSDLIQYLRSSRPDRYPSVKSASVRAERTLNRVFC